MNLLTKLYVYLQNLGVYNGQGRDISEDVDVMSINVSQNRRNSGYTSNNGVYDWELEEAKWRHPSNYNKRRNK